MCVSLLFNEHLFIFGQKNVQIIKIINFRTEKRVTEKKNSFFRLVTFINRLIIYVMMIFYYYIVLLYSFILLH